MSERARPPVIDLVASRLEKPSEQPLYLRLRDQIQGLILEEHLEAGLRLPASRVLARDLDISRTTVELAYDELVADGLIERRRGSGTYVVDLLPARPDRLVAPASTDPTVATVRLSARGTRLLRAPRFRDAPRVPVGFAPCQPGEEVFPLRVWNDVLHEELLDNGRDLLRSAPLQGDHRLRTAISDHLARTRRVRCTPDHVVVVGSTQQALALLVHLLLDPGDDVWFEDPGYLGARAVFHALGARLVPVPVDADGLDVDAGVAAAPEARLAYVTPSHQYPTGSTLSAERRVALLAWARETGAWIVEDDYDSEFRHVGRPLAPLQSFDEDGRVVYIGTFNKALFPGLRLAYLVLPEDLAIPTERQVETLGGQPATLLQATMAAFMRRGHFAAHLRRSRETYRSRRAVLLRTAADYLEGLGTLGPSDTGLHVCLALPPEVDDLALAASANEAGLHVPPLSPCFLGSEARPGVVLGYATVDERAIRSGVGKLAALIRG